MDLHQVIQTVKWYGPVPASMLISSDGRPTLLVLESKSRYYQWIFDVMEF